MNRAIRMSVLALGLLTAGPVEELHAVVGRWGPASYRGQSRRVSRRTARRVSRRHAAMYATAAPVVVAAPIVATTTVVTTPAPVVAGLPIGTSVAALPAGCASQTVGGLTYFQCGGAYYQPRYSGGNLVYTVVMPPQ